MAPVGKPGTLSGTETLDQPPPPPAFTQGGVNPGMPLPSQMGLPTPTLSAAQLPSDVLTGMMSEATKVASTLDSFAQMAPDMAADWEAVREALSLAMSKLLAAGAGPLTPTATGPGFPGGGIDRGGLPLASGG